MLALVLLAKPILATLLQHGRFTAHDVDMAALSLSALSFGLPAFALVKVVAPAFYARQDTKTPVRAGVVAMIANMVMNLVFVGAAVRALAHAGASAVTVGSPRSRRCRACTWASRSRARSRAISISRSSGLAFGATAFTSGQPGWARASRAARRLRAWRWSRCCVRMSCSVAGLERVDDRDARVASCDPDWRRRCDVSRGVLRFGVSHARSAGALIESDEGVQGLPHPSLRRSGRGAWSAPIGMLQCSGYTRIMSLLFRDAAGPSLSPRGSVACVGAFDGVHLGHRALLERVSARARAQGLAACAISFEPIPREFFARGAPVPRLASVREKIERIARRRHRSPAAAALQRGAGRHGSEDFVAARAARALRCARDLGRRRFPLRTCAARRRGAAEALGSARRLRGDIARGCRPSTASASAAARSARISAKGEFDGGVATCSAARSRSAAMLCAAQQLGRKLGYPTANIRLGRRVAPVGGIFAVRVHGVERARCPASPASACGRPSTEPSRCSKRICSTSTAISMESASMSSSSRSCATRRSSPIWTRW